MIALLVFGFLALIVWIVWGPITDKYVGDAVEKEFLKEWEEREKRSQERIKAREKEGKSE